METKTEKDDPTKTPDRGYFALRDDGLSHTEVVEFLARKVLRAHDEAQIAHRARVGLRAWKVNVTRLPPSCENVITNF